MRTEQPPLIRLADYKPADFRIPQTELTFDLSPEATRVRARLTMERTTPDAPLVLMGERLKLISVAIDGVAAVDYELTDETLTLLNVPDRFVLETEAEINPSDNKTLEGLYTSSGRFCTQCEAEGFRKITWFLDRPDVMSRYRVRIQAPKSYPHLLSNGNLMERGDLDDDETRKDWHFAQWEDPFFKPSYLFALVAGELDVLEDGFTTMSGRHVDLRIYVDTGMKDRAAYAMDALKRAMRWDETAYGREYDLDLFMIVAVRDFNFGAMENKGLNIFNASLLLADPATATDMDYERIESVVAHEYFHNWSGNRVTCRDWFQLCLKEGLTVFRDQSFSADQRGHAVQRIKDVRALRARQFPEDSGPLAHPARPSAYAKIDNFYTATVYEKGAEIVGMLRTLVGPETYRAALDRYFADNDGTAATLEDFIKAFEKVTGDDFSAVFDWYIQAGTPRVAMSQAYDAKARTLTLKLTQQTPATPDKATKRPVPVPVRLGLLTEAGAPQSFSFDGETVREALYVLDHAVGEVVLGDVAEPPVLSALRHFSAPVVLDIAEPPAHRFARFRGDVDAFNRWEAAQLLATELILNDAIDDQIGTYAGALKACLSDPALEPAFKALILGLPSENDLAQKVSPVDPAFIHRERKGLKAALSRGLRTDLLAAYRAVPTADVFSPDAKSAGQRALRNALLDFILAGHEGEAELTGLAETHFRTAGNMTDMIGGLNALMHVQGAPYQNALDAFYNRFKNEPLVIDKWFALQAGCPHPETLVRIERLAHHPDFDAKVPNRWRALVGGLSNNPSVFHGRSGEGYGFLVDQVLTVDAFNPMTAARMIDPLSRFRIYAEPWQGAQKTALERIMAAPTLSKNVAELVGKALNG